jgi:hypothetical protein
MSPIAAREGRGALPPMSSPEIMPPPEKIIWGGRGMSIRGWKGGVAVLCLLLLTCVLIGGSIVIYFRPLPGVNLENYQRIKPGMNLNEVSRLMGAVLPEDDDQALAVFGYCSEEWTTDPPGIWSTNPPRAHDRRDGEKIKRWHRDGFTVEVLFDQGGHAICASWYEPIAESIAESFRRLASPPPTFWDKIRAMIGI